MDYFMVDHYTFHDISAFDKGTLIMGNKSLGNTPQPPSHDLGKNFKTTIDKAYRPKVFHVH
jgi:hypothetical protein